MENILIKLKDVQANQLYILKQFAKFCKENELMYTLDFGTILGSIRHAGFIPWDDDIDVAMLRSDYDQFLSLTSGRLNDNLFVQNFETDPEFVHSFTRIRLDGSLALQEDWKNLKCHHGIFIDIFPYDTIPNNPLAQEFHQKLIYEIQETKLIKVKLLDQSLNLDYERKLIEYPLLPLSMYSLNAYQTIVMTNYNNDFNDIDNVSHMTQGFKSYLEFSKTVFEHRDTITSKFEDAEYPIPRAFHKILTQVYGDYNEFPPKSEQFPHHDVIRFETRKDLL